MDKFHPENTYLICLSGRKLAGMLAVRGNRPFSLDQKLEKLDSYLPAGRKVCEIRLLAIEKKFRGAQVLQGILALLWQHGIEKGYDLAIISGTTRQFKLYQHLGFVPFGPHGRDRRRPVPADVRHAGNLRDDRARVPALLPVARLPAQRRELSAGPGDRAPRSAPGLRAGAGIASRGRLY